MHLHFNFKYTVLMGIFSLLVTLKLTCIREQTKASTAPQREGKFESN